MLRGRETTLKIESNRNRDSGLPVAIQGHPWGGVIGIEATLNREEPGSDEPYEAVCIAAFTGPVPPWNLP